MGIAYILMPKVRPNFYPEMIFGAANKYSGLKRPVVSGLITVYAVYLL